MYVVDYQANLEYCLSRAGALLGGVAVVGQTEGCSFAELEETRKLLVLRRVETGAWEWPWVQRALRLRNDRPGRRRTIGFAAQGNGRVH